MTIERVGSWESTAYSPEASEGLIEDPVAPEALVDVPTVLLSRGWTSRANLHDGRALKRTAFLVVASVFMGLVAFAALVIGRFAYDGLRSGWQYLWLGGVAGAAIAVMTFLSRPDRRRSAGGYLEEWIEAGKQVLITSILLVIVAFFWRPGPIQRFSFSRGTILAGGFIGFFMLGLARSAMRAVLLRLRNRGHNLASVVVIGDSPSATSFMRTISARSGSGYRIVAHVTEAQASHDLATIMERLADQTPIDEVVVASFDLSTEQIRALVSSPAMRQARVRTVPELFGLTPSKVQVVPFADFPLLTLFGNPVRGPRWMLKRALDIVVASIALTVLSPVLLAIAIAIRLDSEGPVLFSQERVGMDGRRFQVLKFRTMFHRAPDALHRQLMTSMLSGSREAGPVSAGFYKPADDPRITRVGRFLRRLSVDELPQFLNVLRGEMSLVGPRPAIAYEVELYEDWQRRRLDVLPGMTGLWQVSGRSRLSPADMLRLDVHYAETWSLPKDFLIMLRTIPALFRDDSR